MKTNFLKTISFAVLTTAAISQTSIASQPWDEKVSMTPALENTINVAHVNPNEVLIGGNGPSPSNQALVVFVTNDEPQVLMCKDYDLRLAQGQLRPTHGALKASFGFGLSKDHAFKTSFEALIQGPANIALYKLFDMVNPKAISTANLSYAEGGEGWGPAVTIPVFLKTEAGEAQTLVGKLNLVAGEAFAGKKEEDIFTGRFRDFTLVPITALLKTGNDNPAVYNADKLEVITLGDGQMAKLWDENQMRKNLLPHVAAFLSKH